MRTRRSGFAKSVRKTARRGRRGVRDASSSRGGYRLGRPRRGDEAPHEARRGTRRDVPPVRRLESYAGMRSRRDRLARPAAAKKRSRRTKLFTSRQNILANAAPPQAARAAGDGTAPGASPSHARAASRSTRRLLDRRSTETRVGFSRWLSKFGGKRTDLSAIESGPITTRETHRRSWG